MAAYIRQKPPTWFWIVSIVLLLWGLMGCFAFYGQVFIGPEGSPGMTDYDRKLMASLPAWYNPVYGIAVLTGVLGAVALLMRSNYARPLFLVSLVAVVVMFGWMFAATDLVAAKGAAATVPFPLFIFVVGAVQLWFADYARKRGWIA